MKVLLALPVVPKTHTLNAVPNLGLGYIASCLREKGHDVSIIDCARDGLTHEEFRRRVKEMKPGTVGLTVYSCDLLSVREDAAWIKENMPGTIIVAGGPHPSATPCDLFDLLPGLDYAVAGEGEYSFPRLLEALEQNVSPNGIPGLIYREGGATRFNPPDIIEDIDGLPFPAWDLIDPLSYPESPQGIFFKRLPIASIITTRGCPFPCGFCAGRNIHGLKIRKRSISKVVEEIEFLRKAYGIREFHILDDNFTHGKKFASEFCDTLISDKIDITWCCPNGIRLDTLDAELLAQMKKAGCYSISAGIESGSQKILDSMKKGLTLEMIEEKIRLIKKAGLTASGFFIMGFPGETEETAEDTIQFARRIPLDRASFFNFLPLPGTPASEALAASGELSSVDYDKLYYIHTPYLPAGMTEKRLKELQRRAFLKFFLRPKIFMNILLSIRTVKQAGFILRRMVSYLK